MSEVVPTIDPRELVHAKASNDPTTVDEHLSPFDLRRGLDATVGWYASHAGLSASNAAPSTPSLKENHDVLAHGHQQGHQLSHSR